MSRIDLASAFALLSYAGGATARQPSTRIRSSAITPRQSLLYV